MPCDCPEVGRCQLSLCKCWVEWDWDWCSDEQHWCNQDLYCCGQDCGLTHSFWDYQLLCLVCGCGDGPAERRGSVDRREYDGIASTEVGIRAARDAYDDGSGSDSSEASSSDEEE